ncbi:hypothetical protein AVEN_2043-1 [Araneus ventricosus]|uniref:Uncharacterized protein n=1 Tax=Araneus ventricosus TaxID=182803 RepID=A0A4Y2SIR8_ARAVE|nr:hypothetical protein AVEN_2043-1 [Araneus ventricosus]
MLSICLPSFLLHWQEIENQFSASSTISSPFTSYLKKNSLIFLKAVLNETYVLLLSQATNISSEDGSTKGQESPYFSWVRLRTPGSTVTHSNSSPAPGDRFPYEPGQRVLHDH